MRFRINLESCGNPDYQQYAPVSPKLETFGRTLEDASKACRNYIEYWNLGGGNWTGGQVFDGLGDDKQVARISYNGHIWDMNDNKIG